MCEQELLCADDGGVELQRRGFLKLSLLSLLHLSLGRPLAADPMPPSQGWDALLREWMADAETAVRSEGSQAEESYLLRAQQRVLGLPADLGLNDEARPTAILGGASFELLHRERPMLALRFRLQPGAALPIHDHQYQNGVMKILGGDLEMRSFDALEGGASPSATAFAVRETARRRLMPGDVASLSRHRNNIHGLVAGEEGATVLDIFTHYRPDAHSRRLAIDNAPLDAEEPVYWARVLGRF